MAIGTAHAPKESSAPSGGSVMSYARHVPRALLSVQFFAGLFLLSEYFLPEGEGLHHRFMGPGAGKPDRFGMAAARLRADVFDSDFPTKLQFQVFLGLCKVLGTIALWTNPLFGLEQVATVCFIILFGAVTVEHLARGDAEWFIPPQMLAVSVLKLAVTPPLGAAKSEDVRLAASAPQKGGKKPKKVD